MLSKVTVLFKICNFLNWAGCIIFAIGIGILTISPDHFLAALTKGSSSESAALTLQTMQGLALLIIPTTYAVHRIFMAILSILDTAKLGNPFVATNAVLLRSIGWALLAIQILDVAAGMLVVRFSEATGEYWGWSLAITGWLAAALMFVLAKIFEHGAAMRDELAGTV